VTALGVRKRKIGGVTHMGNDASAKTYETGSLTRTETIDPRDHALVIVIEGLRVAKSGPYTGQTVIGPTQVYVEGAHLGLLSSLEITLRSNQTTPEVKFQFASGVKSESATDTLLTAIDKYVNMVRKALPWASWSSPLGSSATEELFVFDPGQIKPTLSESKP
jgi:hypothetical protein